MEDAESNTETDSAALKSSEIILGGVLMGRPIGGIPISLAPDVFDVFSAVDFQILIKHADSCPQRAKKL